MTRRMPTNPIRSSRGTLPGLDSTLGRAVDRGGLEPDSLPVPASVQYVHAGDGSEELRTRIYCPHCEHSLSVDYASLPDKELAPPPVREWPPSGAVWPKRTSSVESGLNVLVATDTPIAEIMTRQVICARAEMSVETLATLLLVHHISGVPVVGDDGRPTGVVSKTDLLRYFAEEECTGEIDSPGPIRARTKDGYEYELGAGFHIEKLPRATVGEIMMPFAFTLPLHTPVAQAAALMAYEGIHRVVVVGHGGLVAGILSTLDLARWLSQQTGDALPSSLTQPIPVAKKAPRAIWMT